MKKTLLALALAPVLFASAAQAESAAYAIDPTHTFVTFEIDHFGTSTNRGRFDKKEGTIAFDRAGKTGKVDITIDTTSVNTGTGPFDGHLKSAEILNTAAYPTARFVSDKFVFDGDKVKEITGQFTLMGKTHPVTLKATKFNCYVNPMVKREVCGGDFEATVQRSLWGASYGIAYGFSDAMRLVIQAEAVKQ
ncbi:YceI family protein [Sphaerotilus sp.]|jgi:polyisoprenoid-binding protein YceI|uniref:YceI family protein n=1 Tax=Sphaerotilus sp. TaxID=2093942 RepID=UPI0025F68205|nr:YceI family protein [Sphaerotilus sp.]